MVYPVVFKTDAAREFDRLPRTAQLRFLYAFGLLARTPTRASPQLSIKQMRRHPGFWRLSIARWRGVYHFDGETIRFYIFGERPTVYMQFESRV